MELRPETPTTVRDLWTSQGVLQNPKRNQKLMLHVLLLVFLLFSHLEFVQMYLLEPVAKDFESHLVENPKLFEEFGNNNNINKMHGTDYNSALNDIGEFLLVKLVIFILSSIIYIFFLVATVTSSSDAYTAKVQNMIEMIMKVKQYWKKPIGTSFYLILLTMGSIFVLIISFGMLSILAVNNSRGSYMFYGFVILSISVLWIYLSALWMMSLVVSVLEDVGGLDAINKAGELMKGEKVKAWLVMVLFGVAYFAIVRMTSVGVSYMPGKWSRTVVWIVLTNGLLCALKLFVCVVFTIFYHEQKEICDEKAGKSLYLAVADDEF